VTFLPRAHGGIGDYGPVEVESYRSENGKFGKFL
jgi:hypothetical protein